MINLIYNEDSDAKLSKKLPQSGLVQNGLQTTLLRYAPEPDR